VAYAFTFYYGNWCRLVFIVFEDLKKNDVHMFWIVLANSTIMRSYSSAATTLTERTAVMANLSAYQGVGFILGPRKF